MYCEQCGKYNEDDKACCYSCGSPLQPVKKEYSAESEELKAMEKELHQLNKSRSPAIALAAALLVLGAILAVLLVQVPKLYGPEKEAEGFETAILSGNWGNAYSSLLMEGEKSPFLTESMFEQVMTRTGASGFRNLKLEEISRTREEIVYAASYETSEGAETDSVILHRTGKRKFLFLNEWKVDPSTVTCADVTVKVPSEASLLMNGLAPETEGAVNASEHTVEYTFDRLFAGVWTAELRAENRAVYTEDVQITKETEDGVISLAGTELYPDQELMNTVLNQFAQDYQAILEASVNREDFSTVEQYFASGAVEEGRAQNMYANACSQAYDPVAGSGIMSYELSDISAEYVPVVRSGYAVTGDLVMEIRSVMTYIYMDEGVEKSETRNSVGLLCYHQEAGQWKIQSFS